MIGRAPAPMVADFEAHVARSEVWVAEIAGALAGYVVCFPKGPDMFLENVAVHTAFSGAGIGRALIGQCEALARSLGLSQVTLYTNVKMTANLSLYPYLGYRETDRRNEDGFERVYFRKTLT
nr:GNAT family N-acetyltransferase [Marivita sp. S6314]